MSGARGRGYRYCCTCGAEGFTDPTRLLARQRGERHVAKFKANGR
ncbi:hypothetical protein [Streptomyces sp. MUSC 14]|nr:hypothetical protein [Streptomyces sp. MUSC 14]